MGMEEKDLSGLRATKDNPRILMQENSEKLDRALDEFGPVDGIVMNTNPAINELVSGNQRTTKFRAAADAKIVITQRHDEPTATGTVASGYVEVGDERWPYREVFWDQAKHDKGVILANQHAGENDNDLLAERFERVLAVDSEALETLFITADEVDKLQDGWVDHDAETEDEEDEPEPAKSKKTTYTIKQLIDLRNSFMEATGAGDNGFVAWLKDRESDV